MTLINKQHDDLILALDPINCKNGCFHVESFVKFYVYIYTLNSNNSIECYFDSTKPLPEVWKNMVKKENGQVFLLVGQSDLAALEVGMIRVVIKASTHCSDFPDGTCEMSDYQQLDAKVIDDDFVINSIPPQTCCD
jgi:hypothetical protein